MIHRVEKRYKTAYFQFSVCFGMVISTCYWMNYIRGETKPHRQSKNERLCVESSVCCRHGNSL